MRTVSRMKSFYKEFCERAVFFTFIVYYRAVLLLFFFASEELITTYHLLGLTQNMTGLVTLHSDMVNCFGRIL